METAVKWDLLSRSKLGLSCTQIVVSYGPGACPYHVHRNKSCHGAFDTLQEAKDHCLVVVKELLEMGVDP